MVNDKIKSAKSALTSLSKKVKSKEAEVVKLEKTIASKSIEVEKLEREEGDIEKEMFAGFSKKVGVADIAEYQKSRLTEAKRVLEKRQQLAVQVDRLTNQLEYNEQRCVKGGSKKRG